MRLDTLQHPLASGFDSGLPTSCAAVVSTFPNDFGALLADPEVEPDGWARLPSPKLT